MFINTPFPSTPDAADAALQAHERLAASGRKIAAGAAAQVDDYQPYACQTESAAEGLFSSLPGMVREYQRVPCPDCGSPCLIRTSRQMSKLTREYYYFCVNAECGGTYGATMEINRRISPSAMPDPAINLPNSKHMRRDVIKAQMDYAQTSDRPLLSERRKPETGNLFDKPG
ncbi:ogr/Delta-like zinc finger family protein [Comamonas sp. NoAH]|uniref:ogr/Delta-like zinc finger family protein n=1 Tax=Comamonas halotolerans TaxID=3041496 RepID=UPI0024E066B6|nr:ogr/Delta-like zinc finger family protein [Comamonas sp. NoAH]